jgi:dihydrofolate reductase
MNMLSIIACISKDNRAIGYENRLLYHLPSDMVRFRELTTGHTIVMGRKTFESLPNGALPHRRNIVVSKSLKEIDGGEVYPTLEEALRAAQGDTLSAPKEDTAITSPEEIFIIGGESIYRQALPAARKLYLTIVDKKPEQADTFFPAIDSSAWEVTEKEMRNENGLSFSFLTYIRK